MSGPRRPLRFLLACFAWDTHFHTLVPLASALRNAGHEVRVASQPALMPAVTGAGLTGVPVGADTAFVELMGEIGQEIQIWASGIDLDDPAKGRSWEYLLGQQSVLVPTFYSMVNDEPFVAGLIEFTRRWRPDLIIWEQFTFGGAMAAAATGTPHARLLWGPDVLDSMRRHFLDAAAAQPPAHREDPLREWYEWSGARHGFAFSEELTVGQWSIDTTPPSLRLPGELRRIGMRYIPYNGPSVPEPWLLEPPERPRVCLTVGVSAERTIGHGLVLSELLDEFADLDAELVATVPSAQRGSGPVPDNVRLVDFVPLHALMPSCSAIVHHGGTGTSGTAAVYGVPQVLVGEMYDVSVRGRQITANGNGVYVHPSRADARSIRQAVEQVLTDPSYRANAERIGAEMRAQPTPNEVAAELARLVRAEGPADVRR
ncbi:activator-dependent family glycosyltransferase [Allonocardiopsis opalescens]|uniref:Glycosyltransferase DesVII/glycosyltransferase OleGII/desosaminyltransferase OleGI n=1 Tax=Allonocardiopsis opalescens TaxID=1144618 RepID=A0A2T0Q991_9ACTN|nr:activator-dependent family glycosyltransferase [Allonocardiopsis opalescens]PRY00459.1 glycosyltransferase DesVII/glycosyltransferase OleGII/desosaminyltransferase OleGI [Allonocardiopsis opalescens]